MLAAALSVATLAIVMSDTMELPIQSDGPSYVIFRSDGIASEKSEVWARMQVEQVANWCFNHRPDLDQSDCLLTHLEDKLYHASANCKTGVLTDVDDSTYRYVGKEKEDDLWRGYPIFADEMGDPVSVSYAGGGIGLAALWWTLCPNGTPYDMQPLTAKLESADYSSDTISGVLNGQPVVIDYGYGRIIDPFGNVLFRGTIIRNGPIVGFFFMRPAGCEAVGYVMEGFENTAQGGRRVLALTGANPVFDQCKIVEKKENFQMTISIVAE